MKKIYAFKIVVYLSLFCILFCLICSLGCIYYVVFCALANNFGGAMCFSVSSLLFMFFVIFCIFLLNRGGCKVMYDSTEHIIVRKGYICGYEYKVRVDDIREIISVPDPRLGIYYILVDLSGTEQDYWKYFGIGKDSFIQIRKTDENDAFIKQFWDKPIKNMEYADFCNKYSKDLR